MDRNWETTGLQTIRKLSSIYWSNWPTTGNQTSCVWLLLVDFPLCRIRIFSLINCILDLYLNWIFRIKMELLTRLFRNKSLSHLDSVYFPRGNLFWFIKTVDWCSQERSFIWYFIIDSKLRNEIQAGTFIHTHAVIFLIQGVIKSFRWLLFLFH